MSLPTGMDYLKAIQWPETALPEGTLHTCKVDRNAQGMPKSWAGSNAIVFRLRTADDRPFAFRCFTQKIQDVETRYKAYAAFYDKAQPNLKAALVSANYFAKGIRLAEGPWEPAIHMAWVEGEHLGAWVESHRLRPTDLRWLQEKLRALACLMASAGLVHGDLQHRNILMGGQGPVLVDYDSILLPGAAHLRLTTQGLAAFRHPMAAEETPPEAHDRFAFLVMHVALEGLVRQSGLFDRWGKVEGLLFQGSDFKNPSDSPLFQALRAHPDLRGLAAALAQVCRNPAAATPALDSFLAKATAAPMGSGSSALPPWNPQSANTLENLYAPGRENRPRVHRFEAGVRFKTLRQHPAAQAPPTAGSGAAASPSPAAAHKVARQGIRLVFLGLALIGAFLLAREPLDRLRWFRPPEGLAAIRMDLKRRLEAKKDQLLPLIIHMDEELETLRALPEGLRLATLDASSGEAKALTFARLRLDLAQTREQARQALIRCDDIMKDFDAVLGETGLTPWQRTQRLMAIPDVPTEIQSRIQRERSKGTPP